MHQQIAYDETQERGLATRYLYLVESLYREVGGTLTTFMRHTDARKRVMVKREDLTSYLPAAAVFEACRQAALRIEA